MKKIMKDRGHYWKPQKPSQLFLLLVMVTFLVICQIIASAHVVHSALIGDHICYRNESFTELEQQRSTEPVRIREYGWCFGVPPRCSKYRTETKEIVKYQNVTKFRPVTECCEGYVASPVNGDEETTKCIPTCPNGCENGVCSEPYTCQCFVGYLGVTCAKACEKGTWGLKCEQKCNCPSFSCDPVSGVCIECLEGWTGQDCNTRCPKSFYGRDCKFKCDSCPEQECEFKSGECLIKPTTSTSTTTTTTRTTTTTTQKPTTTRSTSTTASLPASTSSFPSSSSAPFTTLTPINHSLLHIHSIAAKSTTNSMAITVLNTSISSLQTNVKNLERQVDEHKRLIVSTTTTSPTPVDLTFVHLSTTGTLSVEPHPDDAVLYSPHPDDEEHGGHLVEVPLEPPEVVLHVENNHNVQDHNGTKIEDKVERHASILIALIAVLCVIATGCVGYYCLQKRCFLFPMKSGKVRPHASTVELTDVKTIEKPLPAIPSAHELDQQQRGRSGSVKSVTFNERLTYYGDTPNEEKPPEGSFEYHIYDEVKYPPTLNDQKII